LRTNRPTETATSSSTVNPAIVVEHVTKRYNGRVVVDDLSFAVNSGEIFALLGPNGAGKSTTIEILEGYREPDSGVARVLGLDPRQRGPALHRRVGHMLQEGGFYPQSSPREILQLFASFFEKPLDPENLIQLVGLDQVERKRYRRLSGGEKQRLSLAVALVGQPELVFLDEPTAGMDPHARLATWEIVRRLRNRGVTVVLTTHLIEEAERLADQVAIIDGGRLIATGTPNDLSSTGKAQVSVTFSESIDPRVFADLPSATTIRVVPNGPHVLESASIPDLLVDLATRLRDCGLVPRDIRIGGGSLEDAFLRLTGKDLDR
jgi:ABC-2 type transport system ATP-binding protein